MGSGRDADERVELSAEWPRAKEVGRGGEDGRGESGDVEPTEDRMVGRHCGPSGLLELLYLDRAWYQLDLLGSLA